MSWKDSNLFIGLFLIFWGVMLFAGKMKQWEVLLQEDEVTEKCSWRTGYQTYLRSINFLVQNYLVFFLSYLTQCILLLFLSPNKMLAWGQQCANVVQFPVGRMLWARYPGNIYCFAFCCLVTGYLCVSCTFGIQTTCAVCAVPRTA